MQRAWSTYFEDDRRVPPTNPQMDSDRNPYMHRRNSSDNSHSNLSITPSTRHMLSDMSPNPQSDPLDPPSFSFGGSKAPSFVSTNSSTKDLSLSVNFLPSKFSRPHSPGGIRRRKGDKDDINEFTAIRGGGREAFRSNEARMAGVNDEDDYDDSWKDGKKGRLRWNRFKWILFFTNFLLTLYSMTAFVFCLLTWLNIWDHADVVRVGNRPELIVSTIASSIGILASLIGWAGILLNNRAFLAVYTVSLWIVFAFLVTPGYITYRRRALNLEGKINDQWSRQLGLLGRLRIQNQMDCCGYYSSYVEAVVSQTCYARSPLPGCKASYLKFERVVLKRWYAASFLCVPVHLACIIAALLCSNHVTYRFGKGMMPRAYRLSMGSMAVIMDNYADQLAAQYGGAFATEVLNRSRSNLHEPSASAPSMPYASSERKIKHGHYESISGTGDDYTMPKRF